MAQQPGMAVLCLLTLRALRSHHRVCDLDDALSPSSSPWHSWLHILHPSSQREGRPGQVCAAGERSTLLWLSALLWTSLTFRPQSAAAGESRGAGAFSLMSGVGGRCRITLGSLRRCWRPLPAVGGGWKAPAALPFFSPAPSRLHLPPPTCSSCPHPILASPPDPALLKPRLHLYSRPNLPFLRPPPPSRPPLHSSQPAP